jgi:hypothetical protein
MGFANHAGGNSRKKKQPARRHSRSILLIDALPEKKSW